MILAFLEAYEMTAYVRQWLIFFRRCFDGFKLLNCWIVMFNPCSFCITVGFTKLMWIIRVTNDTMQTPKKEIYDFLNSVCCIVTSCSWQLTFDKKQKRYLERIFWVTDDRLYDKKTFPNVKSYFCLLFMNDGEFSNNFVNIT